MKVPLWDQLSSDITKRLFRQGSVPTDNLSFRLHYHLSVWLLILFSVTYAIICHGPMHCIGSKGSNGIQLRKVVTYFCYMTGTYTTPTFDPEKQVYPGVGPLKSYETWNYHDSYKWMMFFQFLSFILLYAPRAVWLCIENRLLRRLCRDLKGVLGPDDPDTLPTETKKMVTYFKTHLGCHNQYAYGFALCEILNLVVAGLMMFFWNWAAGFALTQQGTYMDAFHMNPRNRTDPLARAFPKVTKCIFQTFGHGGTLQAFDFMCVMPLNAINEKAAIFFWYYFMALVGVGIVTVGVRLWIILSVRFRMFLLCDCTSMISVKDVEVLVNKCSYADWFLIYQTGKVLEPVIFRQVFEKLIQELELEPQVYVQVEERTTTGKTTARQTAPPMSA